MIVAGLGLQSRPGRARQGEETKSLFIEVGLIVQGLAVQAKARADPPVRAQEPIVQKGQSMARGGLKLHALRPLHGFSIDIGLARIHPRAAAGSHRLARLIDLLKEAADSVVGAPCPPQRQGCLGQPG